MSSFKETLSSVEGLPLLYLFFLHLPSEQVSWEPAVEVSPASLAKPEAVAMIAQVPLTDLTLDLVPHWSLSFLSISPLLSYSLSNYDLG